jgi:hypothetical protein
MYIYVPPKARINKPVVRSDSCPGLDRSRGPAIGEEEVGEMGSSFSSFTCLLCDLKCHEVPIWKLEFLQLGFSTSHTESHLCEPESCQLLKGIKHLHSI